MKKTSLMKENFFDEGKVLFLWKTSLIKEKCFLVESFNCFDDKGKMFSYEKLS